MRVIAGTAKGRRLKAPTGRGTRPTTDRVKESLFGILTPYLLGARVLDLFAGTGALGIEALSRGAQEAAFIEADPSQVALIRENLRLTGFEEQSTLLPGDVFRMLSRLSSGFDVVLADPPYDLECKGRLLSLIAEKDLLAPGGILVYEESSRSQGEIPQGWSLRRRQVYGEAALSFLSREEGEM